MKIKIECNKRQLGVIQEALDIYSRVKMGQFKEICRLWEHDTKIYERYKDVQKIEDKIMEIRDLVYPELRDYAHFGIYNDKCPEDSKIAYDLIQVMRYVIAWDREPNGGYTVDFGKPLASSKEELIDVKIIR